MTRRRVAVVTLFVLAAACSGTATSTTTGAPAATDPGAQFDELLDTMDVVITLLPGEGTGRFAEALAASQEGIPGTAVHLATLSTASGRKEFFSYQMAPPPGTEIVGNVHCVALEDPDGGFTSCRSDPALEPTTWGAPIAGEPGPRDRNYAWAHGGTDSVVAVMTIRDGSQIGIISASGFAAAEWPALWGQPTRIVFYDDTGDITYEAGF